MFPPCVRLAAPVPAPLTPPQRLPLAAGGGGHMSRMCSSNDSAPFRVRCSGKRGSGCDASRTPPAAAPRSGNNNTFVSFLTQTNLSSPETLCLQACLCCCAFVCCTTTQHASREEQCVFVPACEDKASELYTQYFVYSVYSHRACGFHIQQLPC